MDKLKTIKQKLARRLRAQGGYPHNEDVDIQRLIAEVERLQKNEELLISNVKKIQGCAEVMAQSGGSTLQFANKIKAQLDGFVMEIMDLTTLVLEDL